MARSVPLVSTIFVLFLLVVASEMGPSMVAEARICKSPSEKFKGLCYSKSNCGNVCQTEGFAGGECHGFRRRCFCTKPC
ncbi:defensin Ec-AMP-D1-like [Vicia villosa]|uniref:defensin Ec-AMP-D1-like n=1 Tax=Vicia villosa TaxID=3911 RepID=UPI00273B5F02|nr:defensin Ec-AMP-D1-like [Vicia villosa]